MTAVITGIGVMSGFGAGVDRFWQGICSGRSAVRRIESFDVATMPATVAAEVPAECLRHHENPSYLRDRKVLFALDAARQALTQADLLETSVVQSIVLSLGLGLETALLQDFVLRPDGEIDWQHAKSQLLSQRDERFHVAQLRTPADLAAQALKTEIGIGGAQYLHMSACAAGAAAIACAASLIQRKRANVVLCGGTDSMINPLGLGGMARLGATSPRASFDACRPFDKHRDGLVMGEGAALFVIEDQQHAIARGAKVIAKVTGWGSTQDAYKATSPRPGGRAASEAMQRALERAGLRADEIDYVNAHGTGTPLNDVTESVAIARVFAQHAGVLPVSSIKGAIGHAMAAAGALELAAVVLALEKQQIPGTTNLVDLDPQCAVNVVGPGAKSADLRRAMSNSFGFGGHNAVVILEKP
jgi:3-oxoacyl-[acyl-carrier-protein] synthase II